MSCTLTDVVIASLTGERLTAQPTGGRARPTIDEIARLAYHRYEQRGRQNGRDVEDWLLAEQELRHHYA
jgi:hypothetical protein